MKKAKSLWALLLTLAMVLTCMPALGFAESGEGESDQYVIFDANGGCISNYDDEESYETLKVNVSGSSLYSPYVYPPGYYTENNPEYEFMGWFTQAVGGERVCGESEEIEYKGNATYYAHWGRRSYRVCFDAGEGGYFPNEEGKPQVAYQTTRWNDEVDGSVDFFIYTDMDPVRAGYVFDDWEYEDGSDLNYGEDGSISVSEDITLKARWIKGATLTLKANLPGESGHSFDYNGEDVDTIELSRLPNTTIGSLENYISSDGRSRVSGWTDEKGRSIDPEYYYLMEAGATLYAKWEKTLTVVLHPGNGYYDQDLEEGQEDVQLETFDLMYSNFEQYATRYTNSNTKIYDYRYINLPTPNNEDEIFEGWYKDEELTQPLEDTRLTEELIDSCNGELHLYAKYTSDYGQLTLHSNGGSINYSDDSYVMNCPRGMAVDMDSLNANYYDEELGEYLVATAWYSDEEKQNTVALEDGQYYKYTEDENNLYPEWGKLVQANIYFGYEEMFYSDANHLLQFNISDDNGEQLDANDFIFTYSLKGKGEGEEEYVELNNQEDTYFSANGTDITLYGAALQNKLQSEKSELIISVAATDKNGRPVAEGKGFVTMCSPYEVYHFTRHGETEDGLLVGEELFFSGYKMIYNNDHQEGELVDFIINKVESSDNNILSIYEEENGIYGRAEAPGNVQVSIEYEDVDGEEKTAVLDIIVDKYRYSVDFDDSFTSMRSFLINKSLRLKASGTRETLDPETYDYTTDTEGFEYRWRSNNESVHVREVDGKPEYVDVTADEDFLDEDNNGAEITVEIWADGKLKAESSTTVYPRDYYYELANLPKVEDYMKIGSSVKIAPKLRYYNKYAQSDDGYDEIEIGYSIRFDEDVFKVTDSKGKPLEDSSSFNDSCTVTRIGDGFGFFEIMTDYDLASEHFSVSDIINISKTKIGAIRHSVYTGKAITLNPVVSFTDEDGDVFELDNGRDYTVAYKNNTKVGTATVTFTGKNRYYGSVKKTFKIDKLTTTFSKSALTWTGKDQSPKPTVYFGKTKLSTSHYTVTYPKARKNVGAYTVTVTLKGSYSGKKNLSFTIIPKGTTISKLTKASKAFTATWKKQSSKMSSARVTGYQVQYSTKKNFKSGNKTVTVAGWSKTSKKISGLKAKTTYYARVRTYTKVGKKIYYSTWSAAKSVKTK